MSERSEITPLTYAKSYYFSNYEYNDADLFQQAADLIEGLGPENVVVIATGHYHDEDGCSALTVTIEDSTTRSKEDAA